MQNAFFHLLIHIFDIVNNFWNHLYILDSFMIIMNHFDSIIQYMFNIDILIALYDFDTKPRQIPISFTLIIYDPVHYNSTSVNDFKHMLRHPGFMLELSHHVQI